MYLLFFLRFPWCYAYKINVDDPLPRYSHKKVSVLDQLRNHRWRAIHLLDCP